MLDKKSLTKFFWWYFRIFDGGRRCLTCANVVEPCQFVVCMNRHGHCIDCLQLVKTRLSVLPYVTICLRLDYFLNGLMTKILQWRLWIWLLFWSLLKNCPKFFFNWFLAIKIELWCRYFHLCEGLWYNSIEISKLLWCRPLVFYKICKGNWSPQILYLVGRRWSEVQ